MSVPPINIAQAVANPRLKDEQGIMVNVGELRKLVATIEHERETAAHNLSEFAKVLTELQACEAARDDLYTALGEATGIEPYRYIELKARIDADDLADSAAEPLRMAGVDVGGNAD